MSARILEYSLIGLRTDRATSESEGQDAEQAAWTEMEGKLKIFEGSDGFAGPFEFLLSSGRRRVWCPRMLAELLMPGPGHERQSSQ